ncbi:MAG: amino acid adenylation domain-containing protein [Thermoanaerobaculia bacterium]
MSVETVSGEPIAGFRLSPQQKRLWPAAAADPSRLARCAMEVPAPVDPDLLRQALQRVVARHEGLRTTFRMRPGMQLPLQVVQEAGELEWRTETRPEPFPGTPGEWHELLLSRPEPALDLARGPLLRATLCTWAGGRALLLALPVLCADEWTLRNLAAELATEATAVGRNAEEAVQYVQFSEWQYQLIEDEAEVEGPEFWRRQPAPSAAVPRLPFERTAAPRGLHSLASFAIGPETVRALGEATAGLGVQDGDFLLAAWQTLLWRWSGQDEIIVHRVFDGRRFEELRGVMGPMARTLPVRAAFDAGLPFSSLVKKIAAESAEAERWQEFYQPPPAGEDEEPAPPAVELFLAPATGAFPLRAWHLATSGVKLRLVLTPGEDGLRGELRYDPARFDSGDVARLAEAFLTLLADAARRPAAAAGELDLVPGAESARLLAAWSSEERDFGGACVHHLFAGQARRVPGRTAVVAVEAWLDFSQLDGAANRLARRLHALGVRPEERAVVCLDRSQRMIVAALAVLKAGGAFVPLDPAQPRERLAAMIEDSGARIVLTERALLDRLPAAGVELLALDDGSENGEDDGLPFDGGARPENLAYVIFTSGSTGRPKGVAVEHRQLANYARAISAVLGLPDGASYAMVSTFAADLGYTSVFPSLVNGGTLHVLSQEAATDPRAFAGYLRDHAIDCLKIVPSHLQALQTAGQPWALPRRLLVLGGEASRREWTEELLSAGTECAVLNHYGPTETTVGALTRRATAGEGMDLFRTLPIGRPIANARAYLLDRHLRPAPVMAPGQLYIAGAGVARGYLGRPDLTAERFVPDPFSTVPGGRMYRTGDLARGAADGTVEFLGRSDFQVKVRGYRIELEEIEAALAQHPAVAQAVVVTRERTPGELRLAACLVARERGALDLQDLRAFLGDRLPGYMIPASFAILDFLPLTRNGKVDRAALAAREDEGDSAREHVAPRNVFEEVLAQIWEGALGRTGIGVFDDFFKLGGHSLLATQVLSRIREAFQVDLPLRSLFDAPVLGRLAAEIERAVRAGEGLEAPPIVPVPRDQELPLSFAQQRLWFLQQLEPESAAYNVPVFQRLSGPLETVALRRVLSEMVRRHEILRTLFPAADGQPRQVIRPAAEVALPQIDLSGLPEAPRGEEARRLAVAAARRPFDLAAEPLLRAQLVRLAAGEHALLLTLHHLASDAWSMGILRHEVVSLYHAFSSGRPSPLRELPVQYADFAHWQRRWLQGEVLEAQLRYWRGRLGDLEGIFRLPADRPEPAVRTHRGVYSPFRLDEPLARAVRAVSLRHSATPFMTLLAAFVALLHRVTGEADVVVGSDVAGRTRSEVEDLIGFFINMLVLRTNAAGDPDFGTLLRRVREGAVGGIAHQDLPFDKLVEELKPERGTSHSPLFQVVFNYNSAAGEPPAEPLRSALVVRDFGLAETLVRFDLMLTVQPEGEAFSGAWAFAAELFDVATVERLHARFARLLESALADPDLPLSTLEVLTPDEREQILAGWREPEAPVAPAGLLHELFELQAERHADAPAVVSDGRTLTYGDLDRRANQVAHLLHGLGVGPETPVGLYLDRSLDLVVALLGVLKSGGAYVPMDPMYPKRRLGLTIEAARLGVVLTRSALAEELPAGAFEKVCLDTRAAKIARAPEAPPRPAGLFPESLAYVLFTSGSTGPPKGVAVEHRQIVNYVGGVIHRLGLGACSSFATVSTFAADLGNTSVFAAFATGGCLHVLAERTAGDPDAAADYFTAHPIDCLKIVPSHLMALQSTSRPAPALPRRRLILGGEASYWGQVESLRARAPQLAIANHYGPTESTVGALTFSVDAVPPQGAGAVVPLGRPLPNLRVLLLDPRGGLVPAGTPGELCIEGAGLARGYLHRPDLTAERFLPDPFAPEPGSRLYRTGDLGRLRPDGNLEFLGRIDHQVKIRGFRIEMGEVEAALACHPDVREVAVAARQKEPGETRLVAYLAVRRPGLPETELRGWLKEYLPDYMVPSHFVELESLPLTPNGKLDRSRLPEPGAGPELTRREAAAPRTLLELELLHIWEDLLKMRPIGVDQDFFALGGHSLLVVMLMAKIRKRFGISLPLATLYRAGTVEKLARILADEGGERAPESPLVPIQPLGAKPPLFCVHPLGGEVLCYYALSQHLGPDQPFYGLQAVHLGSGDGSRELAIEDLARQYIEAVRIVQPRGPYRIGGYSFGAKVAFEMAQQLRHAGEELALLALLDGGAPGRKAQSGRLNEGVLVAQELREQARRAGVPLVISFEEITALPREEGIRLALDHGKAAGLVPEELDLPWVERYLAAVKARDLASERYQPEVYPGPVTFFRTVEADREFLDVLHGAGYEVDDLTKGWSRLVEQPLEIHEIPGHHETLLQEPFVQAVATHLAECLGRTVRTDED